MLQSVIPIATTFTSFFIGRHINTTFTINWINNSFIWFAWFDYNSFHCFKYWLQVVIRKTPDKCFRNDTYSMQFRIILNSEYKAEVDYCTVVLSTQ